MSAEYPYGKNVLAVTAAAAAEAECQYDRPVGVAVVIYTLEGELVHSSASNSIDAARMVLALRAVAEHIEKGL